METDIKARQATIDRDPNDSELMTVRIVMESGGKTIIPDVVSIEALCGGDGTKAIIINQYGGLRTMAAVGCVTTQSDEECPDATMYIDTESQGLTVTAYALSLTAAVHCARAVIGRAHGDKWDVHLFDDSGRFMSYLYDIDDVNAFTRSD